jgi:hypothetical protein
MLKRLKKQSQQYTWLPPKHKVKYPRWTALYVEETNSYYIIWDTTKLEFISERAFRSWNRIPVSASKESISGYKTWKRIGFAPGSIIESIVNGERFFITGQLFEEDKRLIATPDFYEKLGFNPNLAIVVSQEELNFHKEGSNINDIRFI